MNEGKVFTEVTDEGRAFQTVGTVTLFDNRKFCTNKDCYSFLLVQFTHQLPE